MEDIAVERHFPHIGSHVGIPASAIRSRSMPVPPALPSHEDGQSAAAFLSTPHAPGCGAWRCSRTLSACRGRRRQIADDAVDHVPVPVHRKPVVPVELRSCSINILLSVAPVRGIFLCKDCLRPASACFAAVFICSRTNGSVGGLSAQAAAHSQTSAVSSMAA